MPALRKPEPVLIGHNVTRLTKDLNVHKSRCWQFSAIKNKYDWDDYLQYLMFAYRSSVPASTKRIPNFLMFGQEANCPIDLMYGPPPDRVNYECPTEYAELLYSAMRGAFQTVGTI